MVKGIEASLFFFAHLIAPQSDKDYPVFWPKISLAPRLFSHPYINIGGHFSQMPKERFPDASRPIIAGWAGIRRDTGKEPELGFQGKTGLAEHRFQPVVSPASAGFLRGAVESGCRSPVKLHMGNRPGPRDPGKRR